MSNNKMCSKLRSNNPSEIESMREECYVMYSKETDPVEKQYRLTMGYAFNEKFLELAIAEKLK